jgi:sulfotransferase family protein
MTRPVRVIAVAGTGQNGATLLTRMLGQLPGVAAVGELGRLWDTGLVENRPCSCGEPFLSCPFWDAVGQRAFGGWEGVDGAAVARLREAVRLKRPTQRLPDRDIHELRRLAGPQWLPIRLAPALAPRYGRDRASYSSMMTQLYAAIAEVSGADVIVDSMKVPYHVYLLRDLPIDLRVVHLVRDSRGVAHSQTKTVEKQGTGPVRHRGRRHPAKTAVRWDWVNSMFHLLRRLGVPSLLVRYEDVVTSPSTTLRRIAGLGGVPVGEDDLGFISGSEASLPPDHLVAGNRMRMQAGSVRLRLSDEWRTALPGRQRMVVLGLTWPLLRRYGYIGAGKEGREPDAERV